MRQPHLRPLRAVLPGVILGALPLLAAAAPGPGTPAGESAPRLAAPLPPARFGSLDVTAGEPLPGTDGARLAQEARLTVAKPGRYRFALVGTGLTATLTLAADGAPGVTLDGAGRADSGWIELAPGALALDLRVERTGTAPARLRTLWERADDERGGFPPEPLPMLALAGAHSEDAAPAQRLAVALDQDRLRCAACHAADAAGAAAHRDAPVLDDLGARLGGDWLARWLADPARVRPGTAMPTLFGTGAAEDADRAALVAFLLGDGVTAPAEALANEPLVLADGRRLYHRVGCVACHGALAAPAEVGSGDFLPAEVPAVPVVAPFGDEAGKWRPAALSRFLQDPASVRPDGRMPSLALTADEADRIATYLCTVWGAAAPGAAPDAAAVERGAAVFRERGCASCHALSDVPQPAPVGAWDPARASAVHAREGARYALTPAAWTALAAAPDAGARVAAASAVDRARFTMGRLACLACHTCEGEGGVPPELDSYFANSDERVDLGDQGRLAPDLSGVGWKLNTQWLTAVLTEGGRARPYMDLRMPHFAPERVAPLAAALARREGLEPGSDVDAPPVTDAQVVLGRQLMGHEWFNCMACHVHSDYPPSGSPGPAITQFAERLRHEWFTRYLRSPQRFSPGSRMPDFGTGGVSSLRSVLDGDLDRQIDAMWAYFLLGPEMPPPEGVERRGGMQLVVGDRPMVWRAFLPDVGPRGIAVGLPIGVHYAFDAATSRLAYAWRGDFLDASGSWAGRGGNVVGGQGPVVWKSAPEHPLALLRAGEDAVHDDWGFGGYRLDADGAPAFLYAQGGVHVAERFLVRTQPALVFTRRFVLTGLSADDLVVVRTPAGTPPPRVSGATPVQSSRQGLQPDWHSFRPDGGDAATTIEWEVTP